MKKIIGKIDGKTGKMTLSTEGYQGADCLKATAELEGRLGLGTDDREFKPEYYQDTEVRQEDRA